MSRTSESHQALDPQTGPLVVSSLAGLQELSTTRRLLPLRQRAVSVRIPGVSESDAARITGALRQHVGACGCHAGALSVLVAISLVCAYGMLRAFALGGLRLQDALLALGTLLGSAALGKAAGRWHSSRALARMYEETARTLKDA